MSDFCIAKSLLDFMKLSALSPVRVKGIHRHPEVVLGREALEGEKIYYYWVELDGKVYNEFGVVDSEEWYKNHIDFDIEKSNKYGLLKEDLENFSEDYQGVFKMVCEEKDMKRKKDLIKMFEEGFEEMRKGENGFEKDK